MALLQKAPSRSTRRLRLLRHRLRLLRRRLRPRRPHRLASTGSAAFTIAGARTGPTKMARYTELRPSRQKILLRRPKRHAKQQPRLPGTCLSMTTVGTAGTGARAVSDRRTAEYTGTATLWAARGGQSLHYACRAAELSAPPIQAWTLAAATTGAQTGQSVHTMITASAMMVNSTGCSADTSTTDVLPSSMGDTIPIVTEQMKENWREPGLSGRSTKTANSGNTHSTITIEHFQNGCARGSSITHSSTPTTTSPRRSPKNARTWKDRARVTGNTPAERQHTTTAAEVVCQTRCATSLPSPNAPARSGRSV